MKGLLVQLEELETQVRRVSELMIQMRRWLHGLAVVVILQAIWILWLLVR